MKENPKKEGILLINKNPGYSSFYLVKILRKLSGIQKIGHAGTLDPFATGVMVMLIGRSYTKLSNELIENHKEYIATLKIGESTDTFDCEGKKTSSSSTVPSLEEIDKAVLCFQGNCIQTPPMFSAKKIKGKKLYQLARKGVEIDRQPIRIQIKTEVLDYTYPFLKLKISCSKGTYIRTIAHDLGGKLGTGAHLVALTRTVSGDFQLKDCIDAKTLSDQSFLYSNHLIKGVR